MKNITLLLFAAIVLISCGGGRQTSNTEQVADDEFAGLKVKSTAFFGKLPSTAPNEANPGSEGKILLGYTLNFDNHLSKEGNIS